MFKTAAKHNEGGEMKKNDIGRQLGCLHHLIKREIENESSTEIIRISAANGYILFYLHDNKGKDVFQKDLEEYFGITRSTASKILSLMEAKGLIRRGTVAGDARLKKLTITENGEEMRNILIEKRKRVEEKLTLGFTDEEIMQLYNYLHRMKDNMKKQTEKGEDLENG